MEISESTKAEVSSYDCGSYWDNFEKAFNELNFDDNVKYKIKYYDDDSLHVEFTHLWSLIIWHNGRYTMYLINRKNTYNTKAIHNCNYNELLKFMEENKIRKAKQCDYKDAELYLVDFGGK